MLIATPRRALDLSSVCLAVAWGASCLCQRGLVALDLGLRLDS